MYLVVLVLHLQASGEKQIVRSSPAPWGHQGHTALVSPSHKFASYQNLCFFFKTLTHFPLDFFGPFTRPFSHATAPMKIDYLGARTNLDLPTSPGNARNGLLGGNCTKRAIPKLGPWGAFRGQWCWLMIIWWYNWWWGWNERITNGNFLLLFVICHPTSTDIEHHIEYLFYAIPSTISSQYSLYLWF